MGSKLAGLYQGLSNIAAQANQIQQTNRAKAERDAEKKQALAMFFAQQGIPMQTQDFSRPEGVQGPPAQEPGYGGGQDFMEKPVQREATLPELLGRLTGKVNAKEAQELEAQGLLRQYNREAQKSLIDDRTNDNNRLAAEAKRLLAEDRRRAENTAFEQNFKNRSLAETARYHTGMLNKGEEDNAALTAKDLAGLRSASAAMQFTLQEADQLIPEIERQLDEITKRVSGAYRTKGYSKAKADEYGETEADSNFDNVIDKMVDNFYRSKGVKIPPSEKFHYRNMILQRMGKK